MQNGLAFLDEGAFLHVGKQHDLFQLFDRELVCDIEATDALDFVAEKLNTVGVVVGEGKHIDQTTTDGKLPWLHHEIDALKLVFIEHIGEKVEVDFVAHLDFEGVFGQELTGEDLFTQSLGITDD